MLICKCSVDINKTILITKMLVLEVMWLIHGNYICNFIVKQKLFSNEVYFKSYTFKL